MADPASKKEIHTIIGTDVRGTGVETYKLGRGTGVKHYNRYGRPILGTKKALATGARATATLV